jgi:hypothetical protein
MSDHHSSVHDYQTDFLVYNYEEYCRLEFFIKLKTKQFIELTDLDLNFN